MYLHRRQKLCRSRKVVRHVSAIDRPDMPASAAIHNSLKVGSGNLLGREKCDVNDMLKPRRNMADKVNSRVLNLLLYC